MCTITSQVTSPQKQHGSSTRTLKGPLWLADGLPSSSSGSSSRTDGVLVRLTRRGRLSLPQAGNVTPRGVSDWPEATERDALGAGHHSADAKSRVYPTRWRSPCLCAHKIHTLNITANVGIRRWDLWVGTKT